MTEERAMDVDMPTRGIHGEVDDDGKEKRTGKYN